ncbi:hypothetical protein LTR48_003566 [Friedmanniomyces endolithicus]|uniref:AB hydrolase-1 domain-containing protein n=1 Tax=Rachicladosporium monterosium TaxID=1507873 RepID=A0ABR0LC53_9PEZI|nr:hypothetical protein LTR48_003566 [Friedmanniomyces endolithicus]KAK5146223.1 hypothetical protein LTR32_002162 [Rachicladosporium monterosium]
MALREQTLQAPDGTPPSSRLQRQPSGHAINRRQPAADRLERRYTHVAQTIELAADRGGDVVLVIHSRGGHCGSDAAQSLSKADREKAGLSIYFATNGPEDWHDVKHSVCRPMRVDEIFYNDCTPEQIEAASKDIRPQSTLCFLLPLTHAAWNHIPSTYLVCENNAIPLVAQETKIAHPEASFTVERCAASHSPALSMPDFTADVVRRAAGAKT